MLVKLVSSQAKKVYIDSREMQKMARNLFYGHISERIEREEIRPASGGIRTQDLSADGFKILLAVIPHMTAILKQWFDE